MKQEQTSLIGYEDHCKEVDQKAKENYESMRFLDWHQATAMIAMMKKVNEEATKLLNK